MVYFKSYGKCGYRQIVESNVNTAQLFASFINDNVVLLAPVGLNTVCISLTNENLISDFVNKMNATVKVFVISTFYNRKKGIRAAFVNYRTTAADIDFAKTEMLKILTEL